MIQQPRTICQGMRISTEFGDGEIDGVENNDDGFVDKIIVKLDTGKWAKIFAEADYTITTQVQ